MSNSIGAVRSPYVCGVVPIPDGIAAFFWIYIHDEHVTDITVDSTYMTTPAPSSPQPSSQAIPQPPAAISCGHAPTPSAPTGQTDVSSEEPSADDDSETSLLESLKEAENIRDLLKYNKDDPRSRGEQARDAMLTMELAHQQGIAIEGDVVSVPGRVPLMPYSILLLLLTVITNLTTTIHFRFTSPNFLFTAPLITLYMIGTIMVYHTAYRAQRMGIQIIVLFCTIVFTALVDWGYGDQIIHNASPPLNHVQRTIIQMLFGGHFQAFLSEYHENHFLFLIIGLISFNLILIFLLLHFIFLGRGTRNIVIKNKNTR